SKFSRRTLWIILVVLVLAGGGGYAYYRMVYLPQQTTADEPTMQTATARQGDLIIYASGTGTLVPADEASFGFNTSGQVSKINVKVGDKVEEGQLLAELDNSTQEIQYTQAKRALAELTSPYAIATAEQDLATAQQSVNSTRSTLAYLISPSVLHWEEQVAQAEQALADAQASSPVDSEVVKQAQETLASYQKKLKGNQDYYQNKYLPENFTKFNRQTGKKYVSAPTDVEIAEARANYALAQASVVEAQNYLAALKGETIPQDATGTNLTQFEDAQLSLKSAEDNLKETQLLAPISGTVMTLDLTLGDTVSSGTVATIADLSTPYLETYLDATDWDNVRVGYDTEVTFDALPDNKYTGKVTEVDPGLYTSGNTSVVRAMVELDPPTDGFNLPTGSTAAVDVIAGQARNAVLVPIEALHETSPGNYALFVLENGKPRLRVVEVGIQDTLYAEIKSGLQAGEVVTTGITATR
ncbi:MAG: efflux RND transporter periplasmic adaptor subunit, partial [Anaerolineales bacterium]